MRDLPLMRAVPTHHPDVARRLLTGTANERDSPPIRAPLGLRRLSRRRRSEHPPVRAVRTDSSDLTSEPRGRRKKLERERAIGSRGGGPGRAGRTHRHDEHQRQQGKESSLHGSPQGSYRFRQQHLTLPPFVSSMEVDRTDVRY